MPDVKVEITNLAQIKSAFSKAPSLMTKNLNTAMRKAGITIRIKSAENAPVDFGHLRASHYTQFSNLKATIGTNVFYDVFVHEGTRFMRARPYLRNAVEQESSQIEHFFTQAVDDTLNAIAGQT